MALRINTNVTALNVQRNLTINNRNLSKSLERLSTGYRINRAADDAAGFAVANTFKAKVASLRVAYQNATESNSMLQVADGAYHEIENILVRMKELATQAAGDQITNTERELLNTEFTELQGELDRIAKTSKYNGVTLVYGDSASATTSFTFQIGAENVGHDQLEVELNAVSTAALGVSASKIGTLSDAQNAMASIDNALSSINNYTAKLGAYQNRLQHTMDNLNIMIENYSASESAIRDADMAYEVTQFTKNQILQQSGMAMLAQANAAPQQILQLLG
ncbi:flagellin [Desulfacinum hydrothermale DSM 13146]|uniref:Flagellin n=1 Tax=Desulfacinum hydrothermale DSM 13146 TaxID=1121390 RepID=A0A1W1XF02_9BACT|nr:flagellin [Desulfacinum hydrothermale]SMC22437.1 flagellin [Desulfacinum hydrothermale DSM 13146]